jgi:GDSL-like Lipase/Acylhydrolase family
MNFALALKPAGLALISLGCCFTAVGCTSDNPGSAEGGAPGAGTNSQGQSGAATGGQGQSGAAGGQTATAGGGASGAPAGGASTGGAPSGGAPAGGGSAQGGSVGAAGTGTAGSTGQSGGSSGGAGGSNGVIKIMAIGDSITRATCWRALLWQELNQAHAGKFDLVGTLTSDNSCNPAGYDEDNQGYSSSLVTEIVAGVTNARTCDPKCPTLADFTAAFTAKVPDVILMHFGTNDVWNGIAASSILTAYSSVVDTARAVNPNVKFFVAKIIPMNVTSTTCSGCTCAGCPTAVPALDGMIPAWATSKATAASPITVVDQYTGFDAVADTRDGVHPNNTTGSQKMADKWNAALGSLF